MLGRCLHMARQGPEQRPAYHSGDPSTSTHLLSSCPSLTHRPSHLKPGCESLPLGLRWGPSCPLPILPRGGLRLGGFLSAEQAECMCPSVQLDVKGCWVELGLPLYPSSPLLMGFSFPATAACSLPLHHHEWHGSCSPASSYPVLCLPSLCCSHF